MSDDVNYLRVAAIRCVGGVHSPEGSALRDAADEIVRLRAELASFNQPVPLSEWEKLVAERDRLLSAITWALGANGNFKAQGTMDGPYWWRGELAERAGLFWNGERFIARPIDAAMRGEGTK